MSAITIRSERDLINALPLLVDYCPNEGSIILIDSESAPIAVLYPELLNEYSHHSADDDIRLASDIRVFTGRNVIAVRVGYFAPLAFVFRGLKLLDANVIGSLSLPYAEVEASFHASGKFRTRDEYVASAEGQATLDEAWNRAEIEARKRLRG